MDTSTAMLVHPSAPRSACKKKERDKPTKREVRTKAHETLDGCADT